MFSRQDAVIQQNQRTMCVGLLNELSQALRLKVVGLFLEE